MVHLFYSTFAFLMRPAPSVSSITLWMRTGAVFVFLAIWFHCHRSSNHVRSGKGFPWNDGRGSRHTPLPSAAERLAGWGAALFWLGINREGVEPGPLWHYHYSMVVERATACSRAFLNGLMASLLSPKVGKGVKEVHSVIVFYLNVK